MELVCQPYVRPVSLGDYSEQWKALSVWYLVEKKRSKWIELRLEGGGLNRNGPHRLMYLHTYLVISE